MNRPLWTPSSELVESAASSRFARHVEQNFSARIPDFDALHAWSVENKADFWRSLWQFCDVRASRTSSTAVINESSMPGRRLVPGCPFELHRESAPPQRRQSRHHFPRREQRGPGDQLRRAQSESVSAGQSVSGAWNSTWRPHRRLYAEHSRNGHLHACGGGLRRGLVRRVRLILEPKGSSTASGRSNPGF